MEKRDMTEEKQQADRDNICGTAVRILLSAPPTKAAAQARNKNLILIERTSFEQYKLCSALHPERVTLYSESLERLPEMVRRLYALMDEASPADKKSH